VMQGQPDLSQAEIVPWEGTESNAKNGAKFRFTVTLNDEQGVARTMEFEATATLASALLMKGRDPMGYPTIMIQWANTLRVVRVDPHLKQKSPGTTPPAGNAYR
jgi:hypothetical protein